mmetsp:Transcript_131191/g.298676  ORF Transcript_131191/g.298676 Transcript_131191/m.298676 type:complete len:256 (-) Transcript_131191:1022-1789(-)
MDKCPPDEVVGICCCCREVPRAVLWNRHLVLTPRGGGGCCILGGHHLQLASILDGGRPHCGQGEGHHSAVHPRHVCQRVEQSNGYAGALAQFRRSFHPLQLPLVHQHRARFPRRQLGYKHRSTCRWFSASSGSVLENMHRVSVLVNLSHLLLGSVSEPLLSLSSRNAGRHQHLSGRWGSFFSLFGGLFRLLVLTLSPRSEHGEWGCASVRQLPPISHQVLHFCRRVSNGQRGGPLHLHEATRAQSRHGQLLASAG